MQALEARALLFQRQLSSMPVTWSIPGIPQLDGLLSCLELGADQMNNCAKLAEVADGTTDNVLAMAASVCKSLVITETKERVFSDTDVQGVAGFGTSVVKPLSDLVEKVSGLTATAVDDVKKNSSTVPENVSSSSSPENSAVA